MCIALCSLSSLAYHIANTRSWGLHTRVSRISRITCMNSLRTVANSLSLPFADGGGTFIRLCEPIFFALAYLKTGFAARHHRETTIALFYYGSFDNTYFPYTECKMCARLLWAVFSRCLFLFADSRERKKSARSVASLALRRSPSYKTRSAGYSTRSHSYLADEGRRKEEGRQKKGREKLICYSGTSHIEKWTTYVNDGDEKITSV